jgi:uncharacterized protein YndB with AHSA1/START domain
MTVHIETPDDKTVIATVTVDAAPGRVFAAFTDPGELAAWFWPARFATTYRLDVREGGEFHVRSAAMDMGVRGRYLEVRPPARLAMTWQWDGEDEQSHVLVEFVATGVGRTLVTVTHGANPTVAARDGHAQGWRDCLDRLVERAGAL